MPFYFRKECPLNSGYLKDIEEDRQSKDIIFPERATKRLVTLDGQPVDAGQIMVINSYGESYSSN